MPKFKLLVTNDWERARAKTLYSKEPETIAWIDGFSEKEGVFWDIGANIGLYSLYCASNYPDMAICAFEPMKNNFLRLWQNILQNDFVNVTAHFKAFGAENKVVRFESGNDDIGSSGGQVGDTGYPIEMIDGSNAANLYEYPDYIKIDTDGNEYDILNGLEFVFKRGFLRMSVLVEINNHGPEIHDMMTDVGFHVDEKLMARKNRESDHNIIFTRS